MFQSPADEWRALSEHYRRMVDEELLELAASFHDLTPTAQQALRDEMRLRKLGDPQWAQNRGLAPAGSRETESDDVAVEYTWKTQLCQCDTAEQARQIAEMLKRAGIESWVETPNYYTPHPDMDAPGPKVLVAADELDEARVVAAHPVPADILEQSKIPPPEYASPVCPRCGAADPVLEGVDPVNAWSCEACGAEWSDPEGEPVGGDGNST